MGIAVWTRVGRGIALRGGLLALLLATSSAWAGEAGLVASAVSTGKATGTIGNLTLVNTGSAEVEVTTGPYYVPGWTTTAAKGSAPAASVPAQPYVLPGSGSVKVPPGGTVRVPLQGYCANAHNPPVPAGALLPPMESWVSPDPARRPRRGNVPSALAGYRPRSDLRPDVPTRAADREKLPADVLRKLPILATWPGTTQPFPYRLDDREHPTEMAPWMLAGVLETRRAYEELKAKGKIETPLSRQPEREKEAVEQQLTWVLGGALRGDPHTYDDFSSNLASQYEERTGTPITAAPPQVKKQFDEGTEAIWDVLILVGTEAKVITPVSTPEEEPPPETEELPCGFDKDVHLRSPQTDFKVDDEYRDADHRKALKAHFDGVPDDMGQPGGGSFSRRRAPASAWALTDALTLGGYANAICSTLQYNSNGEYLGSVWRTEPLQVTAGSTEDPSTFTLAVRPGDHCSTLVVGAVGGVVQARVGGRDTLANTRTGYHAIEWLGGKAAAASPAAAAIWGARSVPEGYEDLPLVGSWATWWNELNSSDLDCSAGAVGWAKLVLLGKVHESNLAYRGQPNAITLEAVARTQLSGDGDITYDAHARPNEDGPAATQRQDNGLTSAVAPGIITDWHPTSLTAQVFTFAQLMAQARKNGVAEGQVEGQLGVVIVGLCMCPDGIQCDSLTYSGMLAATEDAELRANEARRQLGVMVQDLMAGICGGQLEGKTDEDAAKDIAGRLRNLLANWLLMHGEQPVDPSATESVPGLFGISRQSFPGTGG